MSNLDPVNDRIWVYSASLNQQAQTAPYTILERVLKVSGGLTLTLAPTSGTVTISAPSFGVATNSTLGLLYTAALSDVQAGTSNDMAVTPNVLDEYLAATYLPATTSITNSGLLTMSGSLSGGVVALGVPASTVAQALAGTDFTTVITPETLAAVLNSRSISAAGLATGGGSIDSNPTITVTASTAAQAIAGSDTTTVITPATLVSVLAGKTVSTSGLATGGNNIASNPTITVQASTSLEATVGTSTTSAMTPLAVAQALASKTASVGDNSATFSGNEWSGLVLDSTLGRNVRPLLT